MTSDAPGGGKIKQNDLLDAADFSALMRRAIKKAGSQKAFAEAAGVTPPFIGMVLSREREPSPAILRTLGVRRIVRYQLIGSAKNG